MGMGRSSVALALALTGALTACGPLGAAGGPAPMASKKPRVEDDAGAGKPVVPVAQPSAAAILGKMKEPLALARQQAFVRSLHDALPVSLASGGLGTLTAAGSLLSNNGGGIIANNGGGLITDNGAGLVSDHGGALRLLQAPISLLPEYTRVRQDVVLHQKPESLLGAILSLYDVATYDKTPGADNEAALIDRFRMEVASVKALEGGQVTFDLDLKVVSSKRIPFVDTLVVRQTGRLAKETGRYVSERMEYLVGFDVTLPDGAVDQIDLRFVAEAADLVPALDEAGNPSMSYEARRMTIAGTNGHGDYQGEALFPPGGTITGTFVHAQPDGARTRGELTLRPDGTATQVATSEAGQLSLTIDRRADGTRALSVRDLAGAGPVVLPGVVTEEGGVGTFDFGGTDRVRARVF